MLNPFGAMEVQMEVNSPLVYVVLGLAVSAVSLTVTRSTLFEGFRDWLDGSSSRFVRPIAALFSCPYCLSHWVSLVAVLAFGQELTGGLTVPSAVVAVFALVALSALCTGAVLKLGVVGASEMRRQRERQREPDRRTESAVPKAWND